MSNRTATRLHLTVLIALVGLLLPSGPAAASGGVEGDLDMYWGKKREVRVIQKRLFRKDSRWEFTIVGGVIPNDEFYMYGPVGMRIGYFVLEDLSVELNGAYIIGAKSELESFLEDENLLFVDLPEQLEWYAGVNALWSPIHGKFGIFSTKLTHFDVFLSAGAGVIGTRLFVNDRFRERDYNVQGNIGLGFRLFLLDWLALRVEYRHYVYWAHTGGVSFPAELTLGVSFFTSAPQ